MDFSSLSSVSSVSSEGAFAKALKGELQRGTRPTVDP